MNRRTESRRSCQRNSPKGTEMKTKNVSDPAKEQNGKEKENIVVGGTTSATVRSQVQWLGERKPLEKMAYYTRCMGNDSRNVEKYKGEYWWSLFWNKWYRITQESIIHMYNTKRSNLTICLYAVLHLFDLSANLTPVLAFGLAHDLTQENVNNRLLLIVQACLNHRYMFIGLG